MGFDEGCKSRLVVGKEGFTRGVGLGEACERSFELPPRTIAAISTPFSGAAGRLASPSHAGPKPGASPTALRNAWAASSTSPAAARSLPKLVHKSGMPGSIATSIRWTSSASAARRSADKIPAFIESGQMLAGLRRISRSICANASSVRPALQRKEASAACACGASGRSATVMRRACSSGEGAESAVVAELGDIMAICVTGALARRASVWLREGSGRGDPEGLPGINQPYRYRNIPGFTVLR